MREIYKFLLNKNILIIVILIILITFPVGFITSSLFHQAEFKSPESMPWAENWGTLMWFMIIVIIGPLVENCCISGFLIVFFQEAIELF